MDYILAIELTGHSAKVGLVDKHGEIQAKFRVTNYHDDLIPNLYEKIVDGLEAVGYNYEEDVEKIGFATAGFVDHLSGIIRYSANLDLTEYNLKEESTKVFKKPVFVLNDANAAALGEFWIGAGIQYDSIAFYTVGMGIGGAIISEGKLVYGSRGYAGEFGHGGNYQNKYSCPCGLSGCLEPASSEIGIINLFKKTVKDNPNHPVRMYIKETEDITLDIIADCYYQNDEPTEIYDLLAEALEPLIVQMGVIVMTLDPEAILISGPITRLGDVVLEIIQAKVQKYTLERFMQDITIEFAELGRDAGIVGAAYFALNDWKLI